jgi:3-oxoacyl-[acyl-carrier protein] reductase
MSFEGQTVVITGGASGFGLGMVQKFSERQANVIIVDVNSELADKVASETENARFIHCDVSKSESVSFLFKQLDRVDILVNNAGITHAPALLEDISEEDFDRVLAVNSKSVFLTSKYAVPKMKAAGKGVILNIASTAGISPRPNLSWYNASKGWMITATKSMAIELAPYNIRVNAINPVAGETPLLAKFMGEDTPENRERFIKTIPIGRFSTPDDIANAACFLCSVEAEMITGVAMEVDGGRCI